MSLKLAYLPSKLRILGGNICFKNVKDSWNNPQTMSNYRDSPSQFAKLIKIIYKVYLVQRSSPKRIYLVYGVCKLTKECYLPVGFGVVGGRVVGGGRTGKEKKNINNKKKRREAEFCKVRPSSNKSDS